MSAALLVAPHALPAQPSKPPGPASPKSVSAGFMPTLRAGTLVRPESVTVGEGFVFVVSVQVPVAARIDWPSITDSMGVVGQREPVRIRSSEQGATRTETATYELAAWDVGSLPIGLTDARVRVGDIEMRVPLGRARVFVKSVLPGDTTLHVPKPAKALFPRVIPWWERWWPALAVVAALLGLWWLWRHRRRVASSSTRAVMNAYARAIHDFDRLERLALLDAGESGRYIALAVEVLRAYLAARVPAATLSKTTSELAVVLADDIRVPIAPMLLLLEEADGVKFARDQVTVERARVLSAGARGIVEQIERAEQARIAAEIARRQDEERARKAADRDAEDEARRVSQARASETPTSKSGAR